MPMSWLLEIYNWSFIGKPLLFTYHVDDGWRVHTLTPLYITLVLVLMLVKLLKFFFLSRWVEVVCLTYPYVHLAALKKLWIWQNLVGILDKER